MRYDFVLRTCLDVLVGPTPNHQCLLSSVAGFKSEWNFLLSEKCFPSYTRMSHTLIITNLLKLFYLSQSKTFEMLIFLWKVYVSFLKRVGLVNYGRICFICNGHVNPVSMYWFDCPSIINFWQVCIISTVVVKWEISKIKVASYLRTFVAKWEVSKVAKSGLYQCPMCRPPMPTHIPRRPCRPEWCEYPHYYPPVGTECCEEEKFLVVNMWIPRGVSEIWSQRKFDFKNTNKHLKVRFAKKVLFPGKEDATATDE